MWTERTGLLLVVLGLCACGPSLKDISRGMAQEAQRRESRPPARDRQRTYFEGDLERPRSEMEMLLLWDGSSVQHGVERAWYPDGTQRFERSFEQGEPVGWWRAWYPDGTLRSENEIVPGSLTEMRWWHPNGQLSSQGMAGNSLREGAWRAWHPDGSPAYEGGYRRGVRHGEWTLWHPGGGLAERGTYRDGRRTGSWEVLPPPSEDESEQAEVDGDDQ